MRQGELYLFEFVFLNRLKNAFLLNLDRLKCEDDVVELFHFLGDLGGGGVRAGGGMDIGFDADASGRAAAGRCDLYVGDVIIILHIVEDCSHLFGRGDLDVDAEA